MTPAGAPALSPSRPSPQIIRRRPVSASPLQVWAVEDRAVQLTWGWLPPGKVEVETDDAATVAVHDGGPGGVVLAGLSPGRSHVLRVRWDGGHQVVPARTLAPPPGELLARVATVSDLHLGATHFGALRTMTEGPDPAGGPHPWRCAVAALDEARAWGAELVVLKGDIAHHRRAEDFAQVGQLVDRFGDLDLVLVPGNHDVDDESDIDLPPTVGARRLPYTRGVTTRALSGLLVVAADTTIPGRGVGTLAGVGDEVVEAAATAGRPALVALHHQLQPRRLPTHWPPGISGTEARPWLDRLARANPDTLVTTGHSHRNRARRHGPLLVTEVASTKDWPGVWAGYAIHEGGIRQVVRRVQAPDAIAWTEHSRRALLGLWGWWSPGPLDQRCLVQAWHQG